MKLLAIALLCITLALSAPPLRAQNAAPSILGTWTGIDGRGTRQTLAFREGGAATWTLETAQGAMSFEITYVYDGSTSPRRLDLAGFESGPLAGRTLYGIVEFPDATSFRFDCEPGKAGDEVRPKAFTDQTVTYTRLP